MPPNLEVVGSQAAEPDLCPSDDDLDDVRSLSREPEVNNSAENHRSSNCRKSETHNEANIVDEDGLDTNASRVGETQFHSIELISTQEGSCSITEDAQHTIIAPAALYMMEGKENSPQSDPILQISPKMSSLSAPVVSALIPETPKPTIFTHLSRNCSRASLEDVGDDFLFAQASKPPRFSSIIGTQSITPPCAAELITRRETNPISHCSSGTILHRHQEQGLEQLDHPPDLELMVPVEIHLNKILNQDRQQEKYRDYPIQVDIQRHMFKQSSTSQLAKQLQYSQELAKTSLSGTCTDHVVELHPNQLIPRANEVRSQSQILSTSLQSDVGKDMISGVPTKSLLVVENIQTTRPQQQKLDGPISHGSSKLDTELVQATSNSKLGFVTRKRPKNLVPFPDVAANSGNRRTLLDKSRGKHDLITQHKESSQANQAASTIHIDSQSRHENGHKIIVEACIADESHQAIGDNGVISNAEKKSNQTHNHVGSRALKNSCHLNSFGHLTDHEKGDEKLQRTVKTGDIPAKHINVERGQDVRQSVKTSDTTNEPLIQEPVDDDHCTTYNRLQTASSALDFANKPNIELGQRNDSCHSFSNVQQHNSLAPENCTLSIHPHYDSREVSEEKNTRFINNSKVAKVKGGSSYEGPGIKPKTPKLQIGKSQSTFGVASDYQKFLQAGQAFQGQLHAYEKQKMLVESQNAEIMKLNSSNAQHLARLKSLEEQNQSLVQKIKRLSALSKKYHTHINEVVTAQKVLISSGDKIRNETKRLHEDIAHANIESKTLIKAVRDDMDDVLNTCQIGTKLKQLKEDALRHNTDLEVQVKTLTQKNTWLQRDLNERLLDLGRERHNTEQLQRLLKGQTENHKELVELIKSDAPSKVIQELVKHGGIIESVLESGNLTRESLKELSIVLKTPKPANHEIPPELVSLMDASYTRIIKELKSSESGRLVQADAITKLLEDLTTGINQFRLDQELQGTFDSQIAILRKANANVSTDLKVKELEIQTLENRITELQKDLASCRDQLTTKSDELMVVLARPHNESALKTKIDLLEVTNISLRAESDTLKQEISRVKSEMGDFQQSSVQAQHQIRELEQSLSKARNSLSIAANEKREFLENSKIELVKAKQEIGKAADLAKREARMHHESEIKNLELLRSEAEVREKKVREELQISEHERLAHVDNIKELQTEISARKENLVELATNIEQLSQRPTTQEVEARVSAYTDQLNHQAAGLKQLELHIPNQADFKARGEELQSARSDIIKVQSGLETVRTEFSMKLDTALQNYSEIESQLQQTHTLRLDNEILTGANTRLEGQKYVLEGENSSLNQKCDNLIVDKIALLSQISMLEQEKSSLNSQNLDLREKYNALATATSTHLKRYGILDGSTSLENWVNDVSAIIPERSPSVYPTPEEVIQAALDRSYTAAGTLRTSLEHPNETQQKNAAVPFTSVEQVSSSQDILRTKLRPIEHTPQSSPLSDVELSAIVEGQASYLQNEFTELSMPGDNTVDTVEMLGHLPQKARIVPRRKGTTPKYTISEPSDDIDEPIFGDIPNPNRHTRKSNITSRTATTKQKTFMETNVLKSTPGTDQVISKALLLPLKPLKSAMKKPNRNASVSVSLVQNTNTVNISAISESSIDSQAFPNKQLAHVPNRKGSGLKRDFPGISSVKGLVSGAHLGSKNQANANSHRKQRASTSKAGIYERNQKSPLMSAPQRNVTKRKASIEVKDFVDSSKPTKAPRRSAHSSFMRTEVPDSQEYSPNLHF